VFITLTVPPSGQNNLNSKSTFNSLRQLKALCLLQAFKESGDWALL